MKIATNFNKDNSNAEYDSNTIIFKPYGIRTLEEYGLICKKWIPKFYVFCTIESWKYLCSKPFTFRAFWCRACGHPLGVVYYNATGTEPDMTCKFCDDDLG